MCSRFEINLTPRDLFKRLGLTGDGNAFQTQLPRAEVRPTDPIVTIKPSGPHLMRWGWDVHFSPKPLINARSETLTEKPTFRNRLENRCLIPATAYFEWRAPEGDAKKLRNRISKLSQNLIIFAGLFDDQNYATIVTSQSISSIAHIHNRMPVILSDQGANMWLSNEAFNSVAGALHADATLELVATEDRSPPSPQGDLFSP